MIANSPAAKYLLVVKNQFSQILSYRFEIFGNFVFRMFGFMTFYFIWSLTAKTGQEFDKLLVYYFLYYCFFNSFMTSRPAKWFSMAISSGEFSNYLLKPISFPIVNFIRLVALLLARSIMPALVLAVFVLFRPDLFTAVTLSTVILFIIYSMLGVLLWNLFLVFMGSVSFWVIEIGFTLTVIDLMLNFVNGAWIPFYLYPQWMIDLLLLTPIPYFGSFSIMIWQGDLSSTRILECSLVLLAWLVIFFFLGRFTYHQGIKKYEAFGN